MIKCNVDRIAFIRHKRDVGLASREFMATWVEIFVPMQLTFVIGNVASWSDETRAPWFLFSVIIERYQLPAILYFFISTFAMKFKRIPAFMTIIFAMPFLHFFIYLNLNGSSSRYFNILVSFLYSIFLESNKPNEVLPYSWIRHIFTLKKFMRGKPTFIFVIRITQ